MTTYPMHYTDNASSWRRLMMLARLYWPGFKIGFIICAVAPALVYILVACIHKATGLLPFQLISLTTSLLIYLSPVMLTKRDYRYISSQLPVTAGEKLAFLLITFWLIIPGIVYLSATVGNYIGVLTLNTSVDGLIETYIQDVLKQSELSGLMSTINQAWWLNIISVTATLVIVIYYVVKARNNRVLAAFLSYFATKIIVGIITCAIEATYIIHKVVSLHTTDVLSYIQDSIKLTVYVILCLLVVAGAVYLVKLYKRLRNCGF